MSVALGNAIRRARAGELGGLAGDSFFAAIWQGSSSVADLAQIALVTRALGLHEFGRLAIVMSFVVLVGQFFDVRVGSAATMFGARRLRARDLSGTTGVFQFSYLIDASTGILGFAVVAALAPFVGPRLLGGGGTALILLFALTLLISTVDESSVTVLRLLDRFKLLAAYTSALQVLRLALVAGALVVSQTLTAVLIALVIFDLVGAVANVVATALVYRSSLGRSLFASAIGHFAEKRQMLRMVFHTNVVSYGKLAQAQLPTLLVGAVSGATQAGLYRLGSAGGAMVGRLSDPAYAAVLPRLSRMWAEGRAAEIRRLIKRATLLAGLVMAATLVALVLLRGPVLELLGGRGGRAAATVLVLAAVAQAVSGTQFWNIGFLYAAGRSGTVSLIALFGTLLQIAFLVPLVVVFNATGAAAAFLVSTAVTNLAATFISMRVLRNESLADKHIGGQMHPPNGTIA